MSTQTKDHGPAAHHATIPPEPSTAAEPRRSWTVFGLMIAAQFMVILDVSVVNVALPSISRSLHLSATDYQWAVSAYTKAPEASIALVRILSDAETQKQNFLQMGVSPSRLDVYEDPEVKAKGPHLALLKEAFASAVARPSTVTRTEYPKVSKAIWNAAFDTLSGRASAEAALADLEGRLKRFKGREWK